MARARLDAASEQNVLVFLSLHSALERIPKNYLPRESKSSACSNSANTRSFLFAGNGYLVPKLLK